MVNQASSSTIVQRIICKNFRCFSHLDLDLDAPLILCEEVNGSGKTSLLEALYYAAHLHSFRTHIPTEIASFGSEGFSIKVTLCENDGQNRIPRELHVGFVQGKRLVRIDQQKISAYREITQCYRATSITEDDLIIITGPPEERRHFLDNALALYDYEHRALMHMLKQTVMQRNALITQEKFDIDLYLIWSRKLVEISQKIQDARIALIEHFEHHIRSVIEEYFPQYVAALSYQYKQLLPANHFNTIHTCKSLFESELRMGRSLFGAHLDDFVVTLNDKKSRKFSSRGQQKLMVVLLKLAHMQQLTKQHGGVLILLDDFVTDLDEVTSRYLVDKLVQSGNQLIFTVPTNGSFLSRYIKERGARCIKITR